MQKSDTGACQVEEVEYVTYDFGNIELKIEKKNHKSTHQFVRVELNGTKLQYGVAVLELMETYRTSQSKTKSKVSHCNH